MPSIYQQGAVYYISVQFQNQRIRQSLGTTELSIAKKLAKEIEPRLLLELQIGQSRRPIRNVSLRVLIGEFLCYDHGWSDNTTRIYRDSLRKYLKEGFPENKSYRAMITRCLNRCYRWGKEQGLIDEV